MLPSPPSTYSRAYIHPAVSVEQKEPGDFPLSSIHHVCIPRLQLRAVSVGIPHFPSFLFFFTITCHVSCKSPPLSFLLYLQSSRMLHSSLPVTPATSRHDTSALSSSAYSSDLGCLTARSSPNAPPQLPLSRQPSCSIHTVSSR